MPRRKTYEEVKKDIESKGIELLSTEYVNTYTPLKLKCKCGKEFERTYKTFMRGIGVCDSCTEPIRRERGRCFSEIDVKKIMTKYNLKLITKFEDITGVKMQLDVVCSCGNVFRPALYHLKKGESTKCQSCASKIEKAKIKRSIEEVAEIINQYGGTLLSKTYSDNKTDLKIRCKCGVVHYRRLNSVMTYESAKCDLCKPDTSKGELKIAEILKANNVQFLPQATFDDCKFQGTLRFDFYLPKINTIIEFDGRQHFEPVEVFGGEEEFKLVKKRDSVKNNYCKSKNIKLIRIGYQDFKKIESILRNNKIIPSEAS